MELGYKMAKEYKEQMQLWNDNFFDDEQEQLKAESKLLELFDDLNKIDKAEFRAFLMCLTF